MSVLIVNGNRIDLVDPVSGLNKSIEIDAIAHTLNINDGTNTAGYDLSRQDQTQQAIDALAALLGDLTTLKTVAKTALVPAINEVFDMAAGQGGLVGDLADLTTDAKDNCVAAINEVDAHADEANSAVASLGTTVTELGTTVATHTTDIASANNRIAHCTTTLIVAEVLGTSDFDNNDDPVTSEEFPYKATIAVGTLSGDKRNADAVVSTSFDPESVLAQNFASFSELALTYDSQTDITTVVNTIYAREPMIVSCDISVVFSTNVL